MTAISAPDLERLRNTHPHKIIPHLSVYHPEELFCGTVTGDPAFGAHSIEVVKVSGSLNLLVDPAGTDLTVYVGTSCGDYSKSKRRYRYRVGNLLRLDENSVDWQNGDVITIVREYDLWSVFPYIDPDTKVFYKDRNNPYTDQNELMYPVAIAGPHRAAFLDGPTVTFTLDGSDSYPVASGATITGYAWEATGGAIDNAAIASTTITFNTPGQYIITLTVTDSNAKTQQTRRVLFVHQRTGEDAPYSDFAFDRSPEGSWDDGGWNCTINIRGDADATEFPDNALCVLWAEVFWDGEEHYIVDGYNIIMVGYIIKESIIKELDTGTVSFDIGTIHKRMMNARCFSVSLEYDTEPDTWWKMDDLTVGRSVHHVWRWHSTLFYVCDVFLPILTSNTELLKAVDDFEGGNLYSMVDTFTYQHGIFAHVVCNKRGQIYVEQDFAMLDDADRAAGTVSVLLTDRDRRGPVDLEVSRQTPEKVSHVIASGMAFNGTDAIPVISQAPGYLPSPWGDMEVAFERLVLNNQDYGNMIAGRIFWNINREVEDVAVPLAGNWLMALDITPQNWVQLNLPASSNKRGVLLEDNFHLRVVTSDISIKNGTCLIDIGVAPESFGPDGVPGPYPGDWPWHTWPPPDPPDYPPWVIPGWNTLMVRNEYSDTILPYTPYQKTVVNDPSSILPANSGDEVTNLLVSSNYPSPIKFVTDGICVYFHQRDTEYKYRIWRHDIETGLADYLEFPSDDNNAVLMSLTCVDIGLVGVLVWTVDEPSTDEAFVLYSVDFRTGDVTEVYRYINDDIGWWDYCYTVQSTLNVYTVFGTGISAAGLPYYIVRHRYNWTTEASDSVICWTNPDTVKGGLDNGPFVPIISGYEIFSGINLNTTDPKGKGYIMYYNFATGEYGSTLIHHTGVPSGIKFYTSGHYDELKRIYFLIREYTGQKYYLAYMSTLTKEVNYTDIVVDGRNPDEVYKMLGNKNRCWRLDWLTPPNVKLVDPHTNEEQAIGTMGDDEGAYYYWHPKVWSPQIDDVDDYVWSFQDQYIIGQKITGDYTTIIADTGITPPSGSGWEYVEAYLYVLGRTFIVYFHGWYGTKRMAYVVHYPGSLVV